MNNDLKKRRRNRVRAKVFGIENRPRASVFRSARYINVQLIDDDKGATLLNIQSKELMGKKKATKLEVATMVGKEVAQQAMKKNIKEIVFDRSSYRYHGRVKAVADAMREGGLDF
jgi:large subunit ribosomal protein L18